MRKLKVTQFSHILSRIPEDKRLVGEKIVSELEFMEKALQRLKAQILEYGEVENFKQGKQCRICHKFQI